MGEALGGARHFLADRAEAGFDSRSHSNLNRYPPAITRPQRPFLCVDVSEVLPSFHSRCLFLRLANQFPYKNNRRNL